MADFFESDVVLWDILICAVGIVPILLYLYKKDAMRRGESRLCLKTGVKLCIAGAALSIISRWVLMVTGVPGYEEETKALFTGNIPLEFFTLLVASPVLEELCFRGLLYEKLKNIAPIYLAMVLSALAFGLYHGNNIQGIYGSFMGFFLAWAMERYRTVAAPLLIHMAANAAALFLELVILL